MSVIPSLLLGVLLAVQPPINVQSPFEAMARDVVLNFAAGRFEAMTKDFDPALRESADPKTMAMMKEQYEEQIGAFRSFTKVKQGTNEAGLRVLELICAFSKSPVSFKFLFNQHGRIATISIDALPQPKVDPANEVAARELLFSFVTGQFDDVEKRFDLAMRAQLPTVNLVRLAKDVAGKFGVFHSVVDVKQHVEKDYVIVDIKAAYERGPVAVQVVFDVNGEVVGLTISPWKP